MPKRNRDKLLEQSMYDLLVKINAGMLAGYRCIMYLFNDSGKDVLKRCGKNDGDCEKCLQSFLNEEAQ